MGSEGFLARLQKNSKNNFQGFAIAGAGFYDRDIDG
jgi:hypothetical protein